MSSSRPKCAFGARGRATFTEIGRTSASFRNSDRCPHRAHRAIVSRILDPHDAAVLWWRIREIQGDVIRANANGTFAEKCSSGCAGRGNGWVRDGASTDSAAHRTDPAVHRTDDL